MICNGSLCDYCQLVTDLLIIPEIFNSQTGDIILNARYMACTASKFDLILFHF